MGGWHVEPRCRGAVATIFDVDPAAIYPATHVSIAAGTAPGSPSGRSRFRPIQRTSVERPNPRSCVTCRCVRLLVRARRTTSGGFGLISLLGYREINSHGYPARLRALRFTVAMTSRNRGRVARPRRGGAGGFTLLEMLIVIVIMGLIMALLASYGPDRSHWLQTRGAAQSVAAAMTQARGRAIASGAPVTLRLPPAPGWLVETVTPAAIVFQPDGSATAGTVVLDDGGRRMTVSIDWLTGRVRIDEK